MAYNPNLYNPYAPQQFQPTIFNQQQFQPQSQPVQQSVNGLAFIDDISVLDTLQMPPGSTSQPYFLKSEDKFVIVTFDKMGGSTKELFSFKKEPIATNNDMSEFVTRDYFDQQIGNIMEAINGKLAIPTSTTDTDATTASQLVPQSAESDPSTRTI